MLFQLDALNCNLDADAIDRAIKARDGHATLSIDIDSGRVRVAGQLTAHQAADAFREAGFNARLIAELSPVSLAGCCGSCSGG
jgi:copper chaperone CopZ